MIDGDIEARDVDLSNAADVASFCAFLAPQGLSFDGGVESATLFYYEGTIVGTGAIAGKVLRNITVAKDVRGDGLMAAIVSRLIQKQRARGRYHHMVFTRPENAPLFKSLGFSEICSARPHVSLLEMGVWSVFDYCRKVRGMAGPLPSGRRAALVVNCNPFTIGHRALILKASQENDSVIVFAVSEDHSLFPFDVRIRLIQQGTEDMSNVVVVPGEDYIISGATFPAYFTREAEAVTAQTRLDATLFASRIAPYLGISRRYIGEEPYCEVTRSYNESLAEILPRHGVDILVVPRFEAAAGEVISASKVREMIKDSDWDGVKRMVPASTYEYLRSAEAHAVIGRIMSSQARH